MLTPDYGDALLMQSGAMLTSARTGEHKYVNAGVDTPTEPTTSGIDHCMKSS